MVCALRHINIYEKLKVLLTASVMLNTLALNNVLALSGYKGYTQLDLGNINVLISVPHDGYLRPKDISDRNEANIVTDYNTRKFADVLKTELSDLFFSRRGIKASPFIIYNNLHRTKMDPNRNDMECCASKQEDSYKAYSDYHNMIIKYFRDDFILNGSKRYEQGLIIDIHGQSHPEKWIELGYTISTDDLRLVRPLTSSIKSSISWLGSKSIYNYNDIIRGKVSLGGIMQQKYGLKVVPSPDFPDPGKNGNYYNGGFITQKYGSSTRLNAIQIEFPYVMRTDSAYDMNARIIAACIYEFYTVHSLDKVIG